MSVNGSGVARLVPTAEQERDIQEILSNPSKAFLDGSVPGTGKTLVGVEVIIRSGAQTVLIICPVSTRVGWENTLKSQGNTLPVRRVLSTVKGKKAEADLRGGMPGIYIITRELFRRKEWHKCKPEIAIYDEIQAVSNRKSQGFSRLCQLNPTRLKLALSATPYGNRFENMYSITKWLWPEMILHGFWAWAYDNCIVEKDIFVELPNGEYGKKVVSAKPGLDYFRTLPGYTRRLSNIKGELLTEIRYVELSAAQRKIYNDLEDEAVAWVGEHPLATKIPLDLRIRLRQVTLGVPTLTPYEYEDPETGLLETKYDVSFALDCKSTKIDALQEILAEHPDEQFLILTDSQRFAEVVAKRIPNAEEWSGKVPGNARDAIKERFIAGKTKYIVAVIASIGEGVDGLQWASRHMVWLSQTESNMLNQQAMKRLYRGMIEHNVFSYMIQAVDTYDTGIFKRNELTQYNLIKHMEIFDSLFETEESIWETLPKAQQNKPVPKIAT